MKNTIEPDKELVSICGLFCISCGVYYATKEKDNKKLQEIADKLGQTLDETYCNGCRSNLKTATCKDCFIIKCAEKKGVDFCGECNAYPCEELQDFQKKMPHRKNMWKSQERIKEIGWKQWFNEMVDVYSCEKCNTINGAYDIDCRMCGNSPSNKFVRDNMIT